LEVLSRRGGARLRVRDLSAELGVTTGSFYRHFNGRDEFVRNLIGYWQQRFTAEIIERVRRSGDDAKTRLIALTTGIIEEDLGRYDVAIRTWATQEPDVASLVRRVDLQRLDILRELFANLGFRGHDLEMRVRTFVTYHSLEHFLQVRQSKPTRLAEALRRVELLTQPAPCGAHAPRR
jgi:AcrR family transcriptional regulator